MDFPLSKMTSINSQTKHLLQKITSTEFQNRTMKLKQSLSPDLRTHQNATSLLEKQQNRLKSYNNLTRDPCLSPTHIKLAKERPKLKKENRPKKKDDKPQDTKTKRKEKPKHQVELNSTVLVNDLRDHKDLRKEMENTTRTKIKGLGKGLRNSSKPLQSKKTSKCDWFNGFMLDSTVELSTGSKKNAKESKCKTRFTLQDEEYLFIGNEFYEVNNFCPTKRILNTFREQCLTSDLKSKFVPQDKLDKSNLQVETKKKMNIFLEARKEIQLKEKQKKAIIIQRWWRKQLAKKHLKYIQSNPQQLLNKEQSEGKVSFRQSEDEMRSPLDIEMLNHSPIKDNYSLGDESIIASFNSAEFIDEKRPKKIQFTKENINNLLSNSYKLPEEPEVNSEENEEIINDYSKFKMKQASKFPEHKVQQTQEDHNHQMEMYNINFCKGNGLKPEVCESNLFKEFQEATRIKELLEVRVIQQKGQLKAAESYSTKVGISTSILATHSFLVKFFNFYIQNYREEFINLINMPYGYSVPARLSHLNGRPLPQEEQEDEEGVIFGLTNIIDSEKLEEYYYEARAKESKGVNNNFINANMELEKIHNRAVLDYFNEELNQYRPYCQINGVPYPWNHSYKALTFYFVTQDNIAEIFQKVQITILKSCSILCGILIPTKYPAPQEEQFDVISFMENYQRNTHGLILEHNQHKQMKFMHEQIKKQTFQFDNEMLTGLLLDVSAIIFEQLAAEFTFQLNQGRKIDIY